MTGSVFLTGAAGDEWRVLVRRLMGEKSILLYKSSYVLGIKLAQLLVLLVNLNYV